VVKLKMLRFFFCVNVKIQEAFSDDILAFSVKCAVQ